MSLVQVQENLFYHPESGRSFTREQLLEIQSQQAAAGAPSIADGLTQAATNIAKNAAIKEGAKYAASELLGAAVPGAGLAAGAMVGKEQFSGIKDFIGGDDLSLKQKLALVPITFGASLFANQIGEGLGLNRKKTGEYQRERTQGLVEKGFTPDQLAHRMQGPGDKQKWFEIRGEAEKDPTMMWNQQGILDAFGTDYFNNMSEFDRFAAAQYGIDNNLFQANKGDYILDDAGREALLSGWQSQRDVEGMQDKYNQWKDWETQQKAAGQTTMGYFQPNYYQEQGLNTPEFLLNPQGAANV